MARKELDGNRGWLDGPAADSIHRIDRQVGHLVQITEAGRTRERQQYLRDGYERGLPGFAYALPADPPLGPSIHQDGNATDSDEHDAPWEENGWFQTALARGERWHREYDINRDQHRNDPNPEEEMNATQEAKVDQIGQAVDDLSENVERIRAALLNGTTADLSKPAFTQVVEGVADVRTRVRGSADNVDMLQDGVGQVKAARAEIAAARVEIAQATTLLSNVAAQLAARS